MLRVGVLKQPHVGKNEPGESVLLWSVPLLPFSPLPVAGKRGECSGENFPF